MPRQRQELKSLRMWSFTKNRNYKEKYWEIVNTLYIRGIPSHVMVEYRKETKAWPIIKSGDAEGYQRFYNFLRKCQSITQSTQWNQLDTPDIICMLLANLPGPTGDKWARRVLSIRRRKIRKSDLIDFIEVVKDEPPILKVSN